MNTVDLQFGAKLRGSLADSVCRRIADEIALGHFVPGSKLDELMLAERFQVSRTPVREALKQLAIMGLVDCRPNRGSVVCRTGCCSGPRIRTPRPGQKAAYPFQYLGAASASGALRSAETDR